MPEPIEAYFGSRASLIKFRTAFLAEDFVGMEALLSEATPEGLPNLRELVDTNRAIKF